MELLKRFGLCLVLAYGMGLATPALAAETQDDSDESSVAGEFSRGEVAVELGVFMFAGFDMHLGYQFENSDLMLGYRYLKYEDDIDYYYYEADSETTTIQGPFLRYYFDDNYGSAFYAAVGAYEWTQELECDYRDEKDEDSDTALFIGGGYTARGPSGVYYNIGLMFAPGTNLETETRGCSGDDDTGLDLNLSLGFAF